MAKKIIPDTSREIIGSPFPGIVGDIVRFNIDMGDEVEVDGNAFMHAWKGTTDVSGDVLSDSISANGNILKLKIISGEEAAEYRYTFRAKVKGNYFVYFFRRKVERESGNK